MCSLLPVLALLVRYADASIPVVGRLFAGTSGLSIAFFLAASRLTVAQLSTRLRCAKCGG
jgi:hypothetical protein